MGRTQKLKFTTELIGGESEVPDQIRLGIFISAPSQ